MCSFRLELCFAPNELFEDEALWLHVSWRGGDTVACAGSGVRWKPGKCLTARQRDVAVAGGAAKYRPSLFLLFEPTAGDQGSSGGKGLMDPHEKLAIARALRGEVAGRAASLFAVRPDNDGAEERRIAEEEGEDLMEDTEEEAPEEEDGSESESESDEDLHTKAERAVNKRAKKGDAGLVKKLFGGRDPCFVFVIFMMALNLIIVPLSYFID